MKQVIQNLKGGEVSVVDVPVPSIAPGQVLVKNMASLVSVGTERALLEFAQKNLLSKALERPDLVRQVVEKAKSDGMLSAFDSAKGRLSQPIALGYSSAGYVVEASGSASIFKPGDRVACAGSGYASHAEFITVPENLIVKIPGEMKFEEAAYVTLGAIALQGLRLSKVELGDSIAVIGLGLVGQIVCQLAKTSGCIAYGIDPDVSRTELAKRLGCENVFTSEKAIEDYVNQTSSLGGVDHVIVCAASSNNRSVELAGRLARHKGDVVVVGDVGMNIPRRTYYEKELNFIVSRSYGPGRYDPLYEEKGIDYPPAYVRWTENRNMEAFLDLIQRQGMDVESLTTHSFDIEDAHEAYSIVTGDSNGHSLAVLLTYPDCSQTTRKTVFRDEVKRSASTRTVIPAVGLIGAGKFAHSVLLPTIKKSGKVDWRGVCTQTGLSAARTADKYGFAYCTTEEDDLYKDESINTIIIATRHNLHAGQVVAALESGKNVFCEKPLALNEDELLKVMSCHQQSSDQILMVGFNRRFSTMGIRMKAFFEDISEPLMITYRINGGYFSREHWTQDRNSGGGRIIGEICHFVDFMTFVLGEKPVSVQAHSLSDGHLYNGDNVSITIEFGDGSVGNIVYVANGDESFEKERIEIFGGGQVAVINGFRRLDLIAKGKRKTYKSSWRTDKGHASEWKAFTNALQSTHEQPIPIADIVTTTLTTFMIEESLRIGRKVDVGYPVFLENIPALRGSGDTE